MSGLIVVPSQLELDRLLPKAAKRQDGPLPAWRTENLHWALCGVGAAAAALATSHLIQRYQPKRVILVGIAGAFANSGLQPDQVIQASRETFADLGYHNDERYYNLDAMNLPVFPSEPAAYGCCYQLPLIDPNQPGLPMITNSSITNATQTASRLWHTYGAACENMEGAAVAMACAFHKVTCHQVRAISNFVGPRDPKSWRIKTSLEALREWLAERQGFVNPIGGKSAFHWTTLKIAIRESKLSSNPTHSNQ